MQPRATSTVATCFFGGGHGEIFNDFIALVSAHETVQFYIHREAEKKNQFSFFVLLFSTLTETGEFFHIH